MVVIWDAVIPVSLPVATAGMAVDRREKERRERILGTCILIY